MQCFSFSFGEHVKKVCFRASFDCQFTKTFFSIGMIIDIVDSYSHVSGQTLTQRSFYTQILPSPPPLRKPRSHASLTTTVRIIMNEAIVTHFRKKTPNYCIIKCYSCTCHYCIPYWPTLLWLFKQEIQLHQMQTFFPLTCHTLQETTWPSHQR